jgi:hypothetical protein
MAGVKSSAEERDFSLNSVKTASGAEIIFYPIGTGVSFSGGSYWGVNLTTHLHLIKSVGVLPSLLHTPSWRSA